MKPTDQRKYKDHHTHATDVPCRLRHMSSQMNFGRFQLSYSTRAIAALVVACIQFTPGQSALSADSSESNLVTSDIKGLDQLLGYLQERSHDLVVSRGMTSSTGTVTTDRLSKQLLDGECLYIIGAKAAAEAYSIWVLSHQGVTRHREPTPLQVVTTGLAAWQRQQVPVSTVSARAPVPRGAQRAAPPSAAAPAVAPPPTDSQIANWLFPLALRTALNRCQHLTLQVPGAMATLPWAALPYDEQTLLIDRFSLSLLPDLRAFAGKRFATVNGTRQERAAEVEYRLESALIVGNPRYDDPEWMLPDLPGAQREANSVAKEMAQTRLLLGQKATKANALRELHGQRWDMVYLATHAVADTRQPLEKSFLALTPGAANSENDSGRWTAREVQGLNLRADMAVLSACQTGLGGEHDAGVLALAERSSWPAYPM